MSHDADAHATTPMFSHLLPFVRGPSRRRIEVSSPKLARRFSLANNAENGSSGWALEANTLVVTFGERPARLGAANTRVIDFWVQLLGPASSEEFRLSMTKATAMRARLPPRRRQRTAPAVHVHDFAQSVVEKLLYRPARTTCAACQTCFAPLSPHDFT
jgi:hypothetical protein